MSDVPLTMKDVKIGLGKELLLAGLQVFNIDTDEMRRIVVSASADRHIRAAEEWRMANPTEVVALRLFVTGALAHAKEGAEAMLMQIMSDDFTNTHNIRKILDEKVPYLRGVFGALATQTPDNMEKCLRAIAAFCDGE